MKTTRCAVSNSHLIYFQINTMFRTSLRSAVPRSARVVRATPARRWASTSSNHGSKSSDMTWAMGSAVVFGSATAYLLLSGGDSHPAHVAVHQGTTHMKEFHDETNESKVPEDANTGVVSSKPTKSVGLGLWNLHDILFDLVRLQG